MGPLLPSDSPAPRAFLCSASPICGCPSRYRRLHHPCPPAPSPAMGSVSLRASSPLRSDREEPGWVSWGALPLALPGWPGSPATSMPPSPRRRHGSSPLPPHRVAEKETVNKMSLHNLATVFGPTLLRPSEKESKLPANPSQAASMSDSWSLEVMSQVRWARLPGPGLWPLPASRTPASCQGFPQSRAGEAAEVWGRTGPRGGPRLRPLLLAGAPRTGPGAGGPRPLL